MLPVTLLILAIVAYYSSRARAARRWRAAWDRYAEQDEAKRIHFVNTP